MIYLLFEKYFSAGGLMLRMAGAALISFLIVVLLGPRVIRFLVRKKLGDRPEFDHADLNQLTRHKSNTPTMGGILIVLAILGSVLLFANLRIKYVLMGLLALVWLGAVGAVDDWIKLRYAAGAGTRDGFKSWEKILFQIGLAVLLAVAIRAYGSQSDIVDAANKVYNPAYSLYLPFKPTPIYLPALVYIVIVVLTMVGSSNAVNLTDGMDGLASGCTGIVAGVLLLLSWIVGVGAWARQFEMPLVAGAVEMTIFCASVLGACVGFLWYNAHPAQVFMGDTGSLPLGGLLGYIAVVTRQEVILLIAGGVFVMESVSVMLQVGYFKFTKRGGRQGKRIFRCAPLHHHFHLGGWAETKVVVRFWVMGLVFAALALATLKLR
ncbi:MAG TPA: phospho-N-acetylmuramoyl-pentapeptide-transferase [Phycisphaerales bacterium]|nr:phospho-N-acetylmuramoyl-pentapeptide-transferase [Phycisphaerales bacterium]